MRKQKVNRIYHLSDAELIVKSKSKIALIRRDLKEFESFGITSVMLTELEKSVNIFEEIPTDIELKSVITELTQARDKKAEQLRIALRNLMIRVQMTFDIGTARYKSFGTRTLSKKVGVKLAIAGRIAVTRALIFLPKLSLYGVTVKMLNDITGLCDELEDLILEQEIKTADRNVFQEDRILMANAIYTKLMEYTTVGRGIWEARSAAQFKNYIIYRSKNKKTSRKGISSIEKSTLHDEGQSTENIMPSSELKSEKILVEDDPPFLKTNNMIHTMFGPQFPNSDHVFDKLSYFEIIAEMYKSRTSDSEKEIWIPIKVKRITK